MPRRFSNVPDELREPHEVEIQGFWNIYGMHLPDDVLQKIYHANAARIVPGIHDKVERYQAAVLQKSSP